MLKTNDVDSQKNIKETVLSTCKKFKIHSFVNIAEVEIEIRNVKV